MNTDVGALLRAGAVIPAHPLALDSGRALDVDRQRALTRYYLDAGAGGLAVGVHTTQFAIREHGLFEPVLELAVDTARDWTNRPVALIAGVTGRTQQAVAEARVAQRLGYHAVLLNLAAFRNESEREILQHCRRLADEMPLIGFALLPECGGMHLSYDFWSAFVGIEQVLAIKMAPFNRYRTVEIVRAVVAARAEDRIALYTGNDDHIVLDLAVPFRVRRGSEDVVVRIRGGLLGHWSVWTRRAVGLLERIHAAADEGHMPADLLALDSVVTDCNGAIYDAHHNFAGCVPGVLEVLRRQGLVRGRWCLDPAEDLSPGQLSEIERVLATYPDLTDDDFVAQHRRRWLGSGQHAAALST